MSNTEFKIIHFNDVYNVEPQKSEPIGGAARFTTSLLKIQEENSDTLTLFSGDVFSPSMVSTVTEGKHLPEILNWMNIDCAVYGNHDFDFGLDNLISVASDTTFPWLMSNCTDLETKRPLGDGRIWEIRHVCNRRLKIGIIGLIESEWIDTLSTIDPAAVDVGDFCVVGEELAKELKDKEGCHMVIALTHMRWPNDIKLAENTSSIDLILGGHDHNYDLIRCNGLYVLKSGTDFREFTVVTVTGKSSGDNAWSFEFDFDKREVTSEVVEHEEVRELINDCIVELEAKMESVIGYISSPLEGRFTHIRTQETNLGNLVTDIMVAATEADLAILNSGTLRADRIIPIGPFRNRDLNNILPQLDPLLLIEVTEDTILGALENSVSQYPKLEGRFPQVSGVTFTFDASKPAGQRVIKDTVLVQGLKLSPLRTYRLCIKHYLAKGRDGFTMLVNQRVLMDEEEAPCLLNAVQNFFATLKRPEHRRQSVVNMARRRSSVTPMDSISETDGVSSTSSSMVNRSPHHRQGVAVEIENRIVILNKPSS